LPEAFLAEDAAIAYDVLVQPRQATPAPLDLSCPLGPDEGAVLALRRPSGALTFHPTIDGIPLRGGPREARFIVPIRPSGSVSRGIVGQLFRAVIVKVAGALADAAVSAVLPKLAEAVEAQAWRRAGLDQPGWRMVTKEALRTGKLAPGAPKAGPRALLFIHGTCSNTVTAFRQLANSDFFERVASRYGDRMFAFDHYTLSQTPEENVRRLLDGLPKGPITFDVITHSRGGLVLRHLVERADRLGRPGARFKLGQAVLVASPNEGTPLVTPRRWEDTIGWIANMIELCEPDTPFTTGAAFVAHGLVWLAKHLAVDLPGLQAMDAEGELIKDLQHRPTPKVARYSSLVANYDPADRIVARLFDMGIDQFFGSANDLIVPSAGGWRLARAGAAGIPGERIGCFGLGGNLAAQGVTHFNIFAQAQTPAFLAHALAGTAQNLPSFDPTKALPDRALIHVREFGGAPAPDERPATRSVIPAAAKFTIVVTNGELSFERDPLLVGHYHATRLTGAERDIDRVTGGVMQRALDLGIYPARPEHHQIFVNTYVDPHRDWMVPRPRAVIVVGLGQEGALTPTDLASSVRHAVIGWAQRQVENGKGHKSLCLASTLLASGGAGISAAQSAVLIAQGVSDANVLLLRQGGQPTVKQLRLVELFTDRASEAWRALKMQEAANPAGFAVTEPIEAGIGPLLRPLESGYRGVDYDVIVATTRELPAGEAAIDYALDTKRARSEVHGQVTQAGLVRSLVETASSHACHDRQIGRTLYKLLVPIELEAFLSGASDMQMVLDDGTASIPWELLDDDDRSVVDGTPWAIRSKLLRKFQTKDFRHGVVDAGGDGAMLVVGEPACPPEFPRLRGAYREAAAVHKLLSGETSAHGSHVIPLFASSPDDVGPDAQTVVNALFKSDWRVIHVAGHGAPPDAERPGGIVLSNGRTIGAREIAALRVVPELVFINCCHLGAFGLDTVLREQPPRRPYDRARFASGLARELINIGVRCVVAAGWAVEDHAAQTFATTFYQRLLERDRFIDAVAHAREQTYRLGGNTWAAYQCYGDPDWQLLPAGPADQAHPPDPHEFDIIGSEFGLALALKSLIVQSTYQGEPEERQRQRLRHLEQRCDAMKWSRSGEIARLFGRALEAVGDLDDAIRWYDRAVKAGDGEVPLVAFELQSNLRIRRAWHLVERLSCSSLQDSDGKTNGKTNGKTKDGADIRRQATDGARTVVTTEIRRLSSLANFARTAEGQNYLGSAMKRLAMIETVAGRKAATRTAIEQMKKYYLSALEHQRGEDASAFSLHQPSPFYPALNVLAAECALRTGTKPWKGLSRDVLAEAHARLKTQEKQCPNFWSAVGKVELAMYEAIAAGKLAGQAKSLRKAFHELAGRAHNRSSWSSVYDTAYLALSGCLHSARKGEQAAAKTLLDALETVSLGRGPCLVDKPASGRRRHQTGFAAASTNTAVP